MSPLGPVAVDPFDLPESLSSGEVVWAATDGLGDRHLVRGTLRPHAQAEVACDLVAVDEAYPRPVATDELRALVHQAWRHGQVALGRYDDRLTLLVPGARLDVERVLDAVARLARALGAEPADFVVQLRLGS